MCRFLTAAILVLMSPAVLLAAPLDRGAIEQAAGMKGVWSESENVLKFTFPRGEVSVAVDGAAPLPTFMGLTSWASYMSGNEKPALMMAGLVLFQDEIGPAMSTALDRGLSVTALHNSFAGDEPRVYVMHVNGEGEAPAMAAGVRAVLEAVRAIRAKSPQPASASGRAASASAGGGSNSISAAPLDTIFGAAGEAKDGMYKFVIGRSVSMPCGCAVGKEMGVTSWAAFAGSNERAMVMGEFACRFTELQAVLKALRAQGMDVVAIHNHMDAEAPRLIFVHYQANGRTAANLARAVKAVLDAQKQRPTPAGDAAGGDPAHHHHH
jgi:hypothetical protein